MIEAETETESKTEIQQLRPRPTQLPAKMEDWQRTLQGHRTINDHVEDVLEVLVNKSPEFRALLEAVWDTDAVEGSLSADNIIAAQMIRDAARKEDPEHHPLAKRKLATLVRSLGVVLRRYDADRKTRRQTVDGKIVPDGNNND